MTVVAGDSMTIIAKEKLDVTLSALLAANPQVTDAAKIEVGDVLNVPLCDAVGGNNSTANATTLRTRRAITGRDGKVLRSVRLDKHF